MLSAITVQTSIQAPLDICWQIFTSPEAILQFNNPFPDWHTARVTIDFKEAGRYFYRMEAKDGSEGFDFAGAYQCIVPYQRIEYMGDDGRSTIHVFKQDGKNTILTETFEPDTQTPVGLQQSFCQNLLNSFKQYVEENRG
jgi:uncharacterized protein YndB with AHSA1/START domain